MDDFNYAVDVSTHGVNAPGASATFSDDTYDALNPKGRRRSATQVRSRPEDLLMTQSRRDRINANADDCARNISLMQWLLRLTQTYCCWYDYHPENDDEGLNNELRAMMARDCEPENIDYLGRMSWDDMRRVALVLQILTGDCHFIPLAEGTLQLMEGSAARNPRQMAAGENWLGGAKLNRRGRITAWNFQSLRELKVGSFDYVDRSVNARNVWQYVQYENKPNTVRGFSTFISALNEVRDIYETLDLARAKIKLEQLFGIAIFRNPADDTDIARNVNADGDEPDDDDTTKEEHYDFSSGPVIMDRDVGEKVELLTADSPGANTQEFIRLCVHIFCLSLDVPFSAFDPASTNFFGSKASFSLYERSCHARRQVQQRLHQKMTRWRYNRWTLPTSFGGTGELILPRGKSVDDLRHRWIPKGVPWWKPAEELSAGLASVAAGLKTMQTLCDETGMGNYTENLKRLAKERQAAAALGFEMTFNPARLDVTLNPPKSKADSNTKTKSTKGTAA